MSKKTTAKKTAAEAVETTKAAACAATAAAIALCVLVTLPPMEKFEAGKGYWQIEVKDLQGQRYSNVYRVKDLEKARALAEKIAKDRKLPIVTQEPPAPKKPQPEAIPMPDPEEDDGEVTPF